MQNFRDAKELVTGFKGEFVRRNIVVLNQHLAALVNIMSVCSIYT